MSEILTAALAVASGLVLLANATEKIIIAIKAAKAPNEKQDKRLEELESWKKVVDGKLNRDHDRIRENEEVQKVIQRALLALLDHGIDGNNIKQMEEAKIGLMNSLIDRPGGADEKHRER